MIIPFICRRYKRKRVIEYEMQRGDFSLAREITAKAVGGKVALNFDGHTDAEALVAIVQESGNTEQPRRLTKAGIEVQKLAIKVKALEAKVAALRNVISDLEKERWELIAHLRENGIRSASDLGDNARGMKYAKRLVGVVQDAETREKNFRDFDESLEQAQALLRRMKRQEQLEGVGISDQDLVQVTIMIRSIDERLSNSGAPEKAAALPLQLDTVLDKELGKEK